MTDFFYRDISHYDIPNGNYSYSSAGLVIPPNAELRMAKATEGTSYIDPMYLYYKEWCNNHKVWFAAYHFLHAGNAPAQAQYAHRYVPDGVGLMVDMEWSKYGGAPSIGDLEEFVAEYRDLGGRVHFVYLPEWYWSEFLGSVSLEFFGRDRLHLVSSDYTPYSDTGPGWHPYGGITPAVWQYEGGPDMDAYRGALADLQKQLVDG